MDLIADPIELPRPVYYNRSCHPNVYYKSALLRAVEAALERVGGDDLIGRFKQGPFRRFLEWRPGQSYAQSLHCIVCRALKIDGGMFFAVKGQCIEYTVQDHALVIGLSFGSTEFDPTINYNPKKSRLYRVVCGTNSKKAREFWTLLQTEPCPFDDDTLLSLANLLIANIFILGHDAQKAPFAWLWHLADDQQAFFRFPWGAYSYMTLRYYLEHCQDSDKYHFYGLAWALIVWGLEVIGVMGDVAGTVEDEDLYPRCLRWRFVRQLRTITDEQFFSIINDAQLSVGHIVPTDFELEYEYYRLSLRPNALDVYFYVPVHVTGNFCQYPTEARPRRQMHDPEDILDADGSRPRRSTQSRAFMGEDVAEHTEPRRSQHRRDTGKRPREASSSGSRGHDLPRYAMPDEVRQIIREEVATQNVERDRKIKGVMDKLKSYYDDLKALFSCKSTRIPASVSQPHRMSPPLVSSARPSGAVPTGAGGSSSSGRRDPIVDVIHDVGDRRDTALPLYTVAESEPSSTLGSFETFADHAWASVTGQLAFIPPFGTPYRPPSTYLDI